MKVLLPFTDGEQLNYESFMTFRFSYNILKYVVCTTLLYCMATGVCHAQTMRGYVMDYLDKYTRNDQYLKGSVLDSMSIDSAGREIRIYASGGFKEQFFTDETVKDIYRRMNSFVPDSLSGYRLRIFTDRHPIEQLVPNAIRKGPKDRDRLVGKAYEGRPWVANISNPSFASRGLDGIHLAVWQSHGTYYAQDKNEWKWQRPRLFCTTEDLFTQTFVVPYIIPMLENAGAVVYTPRERDWQNHEVIVDNDSSVGDSLWAIGDAQKYREEGFWQNCGRSGFAQKRMNYIHGENPFSDGTARYALTSLQGRPTSIAEWIPLIPEDGEYAVYVSYQTAENSIDDAHYTVVHKGIRTDFRVNQKMGGSTWVYLGTFSFAADHPSDNKVVLSNESRGSGVVTADAVRFGSGMGNIARGSGAAFNGSGHLSNMPRWAEASLYYSQWAGMPDSVYNHYDSSNDYNSDLWARPNTVNYLAGGSVYEPDTVGLNVPIELAMAFHSDAGFNRDNSLVGSLAICSTDFYDGKTRSGQDRFASYDLASLFLNNLHRDLKNGYDWQVRQLWNRNYCETRVPQIPSTILEMLSHQNYSDMVLGYDPHFKFDFSRSVYKSVVKYIAAQHGRDYVIQPLPVHRFAITLDNDSHDAHLTWEATEDTLETTARPTSYIVYTRIDDGDFDNGKVVNDNDMKIELMPDHIYSFKVRAANRGGVSFPSETLSACISSHNTGTVLIVNAFNRLEGPAHIDSTDSLGFDLDRDPGVQYGMFAGFCGRQKTFDKTYMGNETSKGTGFSGNELEGRLIMGNTFDYVVKHGEGIRALGNHSFTSCSEEAFSSHSVNTRGFRMIDVICGVNRNLPLSMQVTLAEYLRHNGRLFISSNSTDIINSLPLGGQGRQIPVVEYETADSIDAVNGCGLDFHIYREMNPQSYAVPGVLKMQAESPAFAMLQYTDNLLPCAIAYDGTDCKTVTLGFPFESIKERNTRNLLMEAITNFLCK